MRIFIIVLFITLLGTLTACNQQETLPVEFTMAVSPEQASPTNEVEPIPPTATQVPTATPVPTRHLTVCLGQEPTSLFLYGDTSSSAQAVREAIYDGPIDTFQYERNPVILKKLPSLADGDAFLRPVEVVPGTLMIDSDGNWTSLAEDVVYQPSGCVQDDCVVAYQGEEPVILDELVVQFELLPEIEWSDGTPLTAADSVYSYQVAKQLFGAASPDLLRFTKTYQALDALTVEWVGIPGYRRSYEENFFTPLPLHLWGEMSPETLVTAELSTTMPLGWGPYVIDEWTAGDHITLHRNPNYFRAGEGLPNFDFLVFRFMNSPDEAIDALRVGECDFVDRSAKLDLRLEQMMAFEADGAFRTVTQHSTAWEQITFGITSIDPARTVFFASPAVRQAAAMCIDRQAIVDALFPMDLLIPDTYVPANHPLVSEATAAPIYDVAQAAEMLQLSGWIDQDGDPLTPRISAGVSGVPDGTPFEVVYLSSTDAERPETAQMVADDLAQCGITVDVQLAEWSTFLGPGPDGPVFGRQFDLAQFAWAYSLEPTCSLYTSEEIPGPYPEFPKGWGGGNAAGYQSLDFDEACRTARYALPEAEAYQLGHEEAQVNFAEGLPALPLFQRVKLVAMRPDLCNVEIDPAFGSPLSALENYDYGAGCLE